MSLSESQLQKKRETKKLKRKFKQKQKKAMISIVNQAHAYQNKLVGQLYLNSLMRKQVDELVKKNNFLIRENNKLHKELQKHGMAKKSSWFSFFKKGK